MRRRPTLNHFDSCQTLLLKMNCWLFCASPRCEWQEKNHTKHMHREKQLDEEFRKNPEVLPNSQRAKKRSEHTTLLFSERFMVPHEHHELEAIDDWEREKLTLSQRTNLFFFFFAVFGSRG